ncbi:helix-turn-helix domain-containing protein [Streptomyces sp. CBMA156]|uniref:nSTAND1 domain-containing NTPase n=1 Tax=Streptomyces sp. CBMA156 TaxID=1930280 RepID=UPI001661D0EF|nr:helix-turn-helix domain-containing protein [Streptomyces sp. CBMA156]
MDPQAGPVERLAWELRQLRDRAGAPSYRVLAKASHYSASTLAEAAKGERLPSLAVVLAYARVCGGEPAEWEARWLAASRAIQGPSAAAEAGGEEPVDGSTPVRAPYLGLAAFGTADADLFFGRSELVGDLVRLVDRHRLTAVVGASGSGKSSLLRAGLLPRLDESWHAALLAPGDHPLRALASAVCALTGGDAEALSGVLTAEPEALGIALDTWLVTQPADRRVVLVVDRFEELFTTCADAGERDALLACLALASDDRTACDPVADDRATAARVRFVISVRADFYDRCLAHADLADVLRRGAQLPVGTPTRAELRDIVAEPAAAAGVAVEPELLEAVLAEAAGQPGALPLVAHAMREAWTRHQGNVLRLVDYQATGGMRGAITQTAEAVYAGFPPEHQEAMRMLFLRLTAPGEGTEDTRRRLARGELDGLADAGTMDDLLHRLAAARLVVLSDGTVDVAHEAVIRAWPRLRHWLDVDREALRAHRRLTQAALTWHELHRDPGALYRGVQLAAAQGRPRTGGATLNRLESAFVAASVAADGRRGRRRRWTVITLAVLTALSLVLAATAYVQKTQSDAQRHIAVSRERAAQSRQFLEKDPETAALVALEGYRAARTTEARGSLLSAYSAYSSKQFTGHTGAVVTVAYAPDGRTLATGSADHTVKLWDTATHRMLATLTGHGSSVMTVAFSPDGRTLASAGADRTVRLWDVASGRTTDVLAGHTGAVWSAAFSPDGRTLATGSADHTVRLWDVKSGRTLSTLAGHTDTVRSVAYAPDGLTLVTGSADHTVQLWDTIGPQVTSTFTGHTGAVGTVAVSPDGRTLATGSADRTVRLWSLTSHKGTAVLNGHAQEVSQVAFTADGRTLATISQDSTFALWDVAEQRMTDTLHETNTAAPALALSPDGTELATTAADNIVHAWNVRDRRATATIGTTNDIPTAAAYAPDGRTLAVGHADGSVTSWATDPPHPLATFTAHNQDIMHLAFSPDGRLLATASSGNTVRLWDAASGRPVAPLEGHTSNVSSVAFAPDGRTLATSSYDRTVRLWDVATHRSTAVLQGHTNLVAKVVFAPDGRTLASAGYDRTVRLWDLASHRELAALPEDTAAVVALAYSPDGRTLATGGGDATVRLWDVAQRRTIVTLTGHMNTVFSAAFSADGRTLATTDAGGAVCLWDVAAHRLAARLVGHTRGVHAAAFSPDRSALLTAGSDGIRLWATDVDRIADRVCELSRTNRWLGLFPEATTGDACR